MKIGDADNTGTGKTGKVYVTEFDASGKPGTPILLNQLPSAQNDVRIGEIGKVDDEIRDLNEAEVTEIVEHVAGQLGEIEMNDQLRAWIVKSIEIAIEIVEQVQEGIEIL